MVDSVVVVVGLLVASKRGGLLVVTGGDFVVVFMGMLVVAVVAVVVVVNGDVTLGISVVDTGLFVKTILLLSDKEVLCVEDGVTEVVEGVVDAAVVLESVLVAAVVVMVPFCLLILGRNLKWPVLRGVAVVVVVVVEVVVDGGSSVVVSCLCFFRKDSTGREGKSAERSQGEEFSSDDEGVDWVVVVVGGLTDVPGVIATLAVSVDGLGDASVVVIVVAVVVAVVVVVVSVVVEVAMVVVDDVAGSVV